ncbi:hypothetical protein [Streptomyces sp. H23]|uniref:hypothetical protein n=1 Tax=Streptomyces sp. H23 TaxID=2541723 RepID=UPI00106DD693|nr:hypothetical protein [Streptomyces sp. H23]
MYLGLMRFELVDRGDDRLALGLSTGAAERDRLADGLEVVGFGDLQDVVLLGPGHQAEQDSGLLVELLLVEAARAATEGDLVHGR